jgi:hypothetical protein
MNALEKKNSTAFFERAVNVITKHFGELTESDTKELRKTVFDSTWKREGEWFSKMRTKMGKSIPEIAGELKIKESHLKKLEKGNDFKQRDITAQFIENYYRLRTK